MSMWRFWCRTCGDVPRDARQPETWGMAVSRFAIHDRNHARQLEEVK